MNSIFRKSTIVFISIVSSFLLLTGSVFAYDSFIKNEPDTDVVETHDYSPRIGNGIESNVVDTTNTTYITDVVSYQNLTVGKTYTVRGRLFEIQIDDDGNPSPVDTGITGSSSFVVENDDNVILLSRTQKINSGSVQVKYNMAGYGGIAGKTFVAKETISIDKNTTLTLEDYSAERYIRVPSVTVSFAETTSGQKLIVPAADTSITITVDYQNLIPGKEYTISGNILQKNDSSRGSPWVAIKQNGEYCSYSYTFIPSETNGTVSLNTSLDSSNLVGKKLSISSKLSSTLNDIYFSVYDNNGYVNIDDAMRVINVTRTVSCQNTNTCVASSVMDEKINVSISCVNFIPNESYYIASSLRDAQTDAILMDSNGNLLTKETTVRINKENQQVDFSYNIPSATNLSGKTVYCKTVVSYNNRVLKIIGDMSDPQSPVYFANISSLSIHVNGNSTQSFTLDTSNSVTGTVVIDNICTDRSYRIAYGFKGVTNTVNPNSANSGSSSSNNVSYKTIHSNQPSYTLDVSFPSPNIQRYLGVVLYPYVKLYYGSVLIAVYDTSVSASGILVPTPSPTLGPTPTPAPTPVPEPDNSSSYDYTVYITQSGHCYHSSNCSYARNSRPVSLSYALSRGLRPCSRCNPDW